MLALGVELGVAFRSLREGQASDAALHTSAFVTLGFLYLGIRHDEPFTKLSEGTWQPGETHFVLGIKAPVFNNEGPGLRRMQGRPLVIEQGQKIALLRRRTDWG